jgi:hypothetical protein
LIKDYHIIMDTTKPTRGGAGRGQGRKPLDAERPTVVVSVKMSDAQRDKLQRLGGAGWIRSKIDKAREPGEKE